MENQTHAYFGRILHDQKNALTKQYVKLLATEGVTLSFTDDALDEVHAERSTRNGKRHRSNGSPIVPLRAQSSMKRLTIHVQPLWLYQGRDAFEWSTSLCRGR